MCRRAAYHGNQKQKKSPNPSEELKEISKQQEANVTDQ